MKKALILLLSALAGFAVQAQTAASAPAPQASPRAADKLVAMCIGCHNIPGYQASFPEVHKVPMIAGQGAKYIVAALQAYKKGDRKHPTMRGIAASLSDQDMNDIAGYYEQLGKKEGAVPVPETPAVQPSAEVQALLTKGACASCHGTNLNKPLDPSYPKIAGQHGDYLYVALKAYQLDGNVHLGRSNPIMAAQAKQFSLAELKALSKYIGSLPGDLKTVPQSRFR
ncbi:MAG: c-type cytochrome [Pseudomonadota bacterium]